MEWRRELPWTGTGKALGIVAFLSDVSVYVTYIISLPPVWTAELHGAFENH